MRTFRRWWTYQRERFPLLAHGTLILVLVASTFGFVAAVRGAALVGWVPAIAAFASAFLVFLQLRVADEFKDHEEDAAHRPYRPVPRGLVKLSELRVVALGAALVQLALALLVDARLVPLLALVWAYVLLMTKEFFVPAWLKARPAFYMGSHMVVLPLVVLYVAAFDLVPARAAWPPALLGFLGLAYLGGVVAEVGRKVRAPADEEPGVETYSALWGRRRAIAVWLLAMAGASLTAAATWLALLGARAWPVAAAPAAALLASAAVAVVFLRSPRPGAGKRIELAGAVWLVVTYLAAGLLPHALEV